MARGSQLPSDPAFLVKYVKELPIDSESDKELEGYLVAEDGLDINVWDETVATPQGLSLSCNDLAALQDAAALPEEPLARRAPPSHLCKART